MPPQKYSPNRPRRGRHSGIAADGEPEAEAVAGREQETRADAHLRAEVIGGHKRERLAAENARSCERATFIEHQQETRVVVHRRDEPTATHFKAWRSAHVDEFYCCPGIGVLREGFGKALMLVGRREESGIVHAER